MTDALMFWLSRRLRRPITVGPITWEYRTMHFITRREPGDG